MFHKGVQAIGVIIEVGVSGHGETCVRLWEGREVMLFPLGYRLSLRHTRNVSRCICMRSPIRVNTMPSLLLLVVDRDASLSVHVGKLMISLLIPLFEGTYLHAMKSSKRSDWSGDIQGKMLPECLQIHTVHNTPLTSFNMVFWRSLYSTSVTIGSRGLLL